LSVAASPPPKATAPHTELVVQVTPKSYGPPFLLPALQLGAFNNDEIRGDNYVLGVMGVPHEWFRLPDILGGNAYFGGWLEQGSASDRWRGALLETLFGPAFPGYSQSLSDGGGRFYIALGPFVQ
jgi:hypothetical protein